MKDLPPSPLMAYTTPASEQQGLNVLVKMDHLRYLSAYPGDMALGGNKLRKLQYNIVNALRQNKGLLSFGGPFSNHIAALASAGSIFKIPTLGLIRGEDHSDHNPTLQHAIQCGMTLRFVDRSTYRLRNHPHFLQTLQKEYPNYYIIPEGGTNALALKGVEAIIKELTHQYSAPIDYWITPVGTGGTLAGLLNALPKDAFAVGVSVLKGNFLEREVHRLVEPRGWTNWELITDYHFGGYAKWSEKLISSMQELKREKGMATDPIYTGKLFYAVNDLIEKNYFKKGSTLVVLHTGGLQGNKGFQYRWPSVIL